MKRKIVWMVVSGWMVAALLLTSCAPAVVEEEAKEEANMVKWTGTRQDGTVVEKMIEIPRYGGSLVTGENILVVQLDPSERGGHRARGSNPMVEPLVGTDFTKGPVGTNEWSGFVSIPTPYGLTTGRLAESWEMPDDTTLVYHIRQGVHFALDPNNEASQLVGGREMTAADVVASFLHHYRPGTWAARNYNVLTDMENLEKSIYVSPDDPWTVVFKVQPGRAGTVFIYPGIMQGRIMAPEALQKYGAPVTDWKQVVGTGPFILKDYVAASALTYERNPNYWAHDPFFPENQLPYVDTFKILFIVDRSTQMAALRTGQIDNLWSDLQAEDAESLLETNPKLKSASFLGLVPAIGMRNDTKPFDDIRVRRALMLAIDHQELVDDYYEGKASLFNVPIADLPDFADFRTPLEELPQSIQELYEYHTDKARQLLAEAGYPEGFQTEVLTPPRYVDLLSVIKVYWAEIGVDLKIDVRDETVYRTTWQKLNHKQMVISEPNVRNPWSLSWLKTSNVSIINDPVIMPLRAEIDRRYFNPAELKSVLTTPLGEVLPDLPEAKGLPSFVEHVNEQVWFVSLPVPYIYQVWQPWLKAYEGNKTPSYGDMYGYSTYVWIDQELKEAMGR